MRKSRLTIQHSSSRSSLHCLREKLLSRWRVTDLKLLDFHRNGNSFGSEFLDWSSLNEETKSTPGKQGRRGRFTIKAFYVLPIYGGTTGFRAATSSPSVFKLLLVSHLPKKTNEQRLIKDMTLRRFTILRRNFLSLWSHVCVFLIDRRSEGEATLICGR